MLRELTIKNYKSILDHTIELGRINVFIGENGCGKTNILEAVAMAAAALTGKLTVEELFNRGMRVAKPGIMRSSFPGSKDKEIVIGCGFDPDGSHEPRDVELRVLGIERPGAEVMWTAMHDEETAQLLLDVRVRSALRGLRDVLEQQIDSFAPPPNVNRSEAHVATSDERRKNYFALGDLIGDFGVYDATTLILRGLVASSRRTPIGLYGENLDVAISALEPAVSEDLLERARCISWLDKFVVDPADAPKYEGHKLGRSQSTLYFQDKHMRRKNNVFSAENVNEGILHILFHLTLFMHPGTPKVLGIDNIETALNPQLCRDLMAQLPALAEKHGKQALITTHNPAILDGLNLHDDEQRLFVVSRDDEGHTVTKRIKIKKQPEGAPIKYKLSELWMRGHLGGLPETF